MAHLGVKIAGFVQGDDLEIRRTVVDLPSPIDAAWLTLKRSATEPDASAALQKKITTENVVGLGAIEEAGGNGDDGELRFDLTPADTESLSSLRYVHDIQIKLESGKVYTIEKGTVQLIRDVTKSTT